MHSMGSTLVYNTPQREEDYSKKQQLDIVVRRHNSRKRLESFIERKF